MTVGDDSPLIEYRDAVVVRGESRILDGVRLTIRRGENVAILGPNGAGKSTLVELLTGDARAMTPEDGRASVLLLGQDRWDLFELRNHLGVVSDRLQETYDRPVSVEDTVLSGFFGSIGIYPHHRVTSEMRDRTRTALEFLEIGHLAPRWMSTLSTGEARRALIGRALVHEPGTLVLDEPYNGLDPNARRHVRDAIRRLAKEGTGIVIVTHDVSDIVPDISRVVAIKNGKVFADLPKEHALTPTLLSDLFAMPVEVIERHGYYHLW